MDYYNESVLEVNLLICRQAKLDKEPIWIGLQNKNGSESKNPKLGWEWLDGSTYSFMAWQINEPESGEKYVRIKEGFWLGITQGSFNHFLCQRGKV